MLITLLLHEEGHTRSLFEAIDGIRRSFGRNTLMLGVQGDGMIRMAQEYCSPHYATRWEDVPGVVVR